ncbi:MAG: hypothetical protein ABI761_17580 [Saprospiraceae bacterium]
MIKNVLILLTYWMMGCNDASDKKVAVAPAINDTLAASGYVWTKLLDSGSWKKSYNFQMFTMRDTLWIFHPDGNWYSTDGIQWTKSRLENAIYNLAFLDYVPFKNAI